MNRKLITMSIAFGAVSLVGLVFLSQSESFGATQIRRLYGCDENVEVRSLTVLKGWVNDSPVEGKISAVINTGRGGVSSCKFNRLPKGFNAATFGTHQ